MSAPRSTNMITMPPRTPTASVRTVSRGKTTSDATTRGTRRRHAHRLDPAEDQPEVLGRERQAPHDAAREEAEPAVPDDRAPQGEFQPRHSVAKLSTSSRNAVRQVSKDSGGATSAKSYTHRSSFITYVSTRVRASPAARRPSSTAWTARRPSTATSSHSTMARL